MLRIITDQSEAQAELKRIRDRTHNEHIHSQTATVKEIITTVRKKGNQALFDYTKQFDEQEVNVNNLKVSGSEIDAAYQQISRDLLNSIKKKKKKEII